MSAPVQITRDLSPAGVVKACAHWLPVNLPVEVAIQAHQIAFARYVDEGEPVRELAARTLRAVILSKTGSAADCQMQLDYLAPLPVSAWEAWECHCPTIREDTLAAITRSIGWLQLN